MLLPQISPKMMRMIRAWVDKNAVQWDTRVQAHALLLTNPLVRTVAQLVIRLFAPPQPVRIVRSEAEALAFHASCCARPVSPLPCIAASCATPAELSSIGRKSWIWRVCDTRQASCAISSSRSTPRRSRPRQMIESKCTPPPSAGAGTPP